MKLSRHSTETVTSKQYKIPIIYTIYDIYC